MSNYKYQNANQWWAIQSGDFQKFIFPSTLSSWRSAAITDFMAHHNHDKNIKTWKQAYRKGYRAVRVEIKNIGNFGNG